MNKSTLVAAMAESLGLPKADVRIILDTMASLVATAVKRSKGNETIQVLPGVVTVRKVWKKATKARDGINPATGEAIRIKAKPAQWKVRARVSRAVQEIARRGR